LRAAPEENRVFVVDLDHADGRLVGERVLVYLLSE